MDTGAGLASGEASDFQGSFHGSRVTSGSSERGEEEVCMQPFTTEAAERLIGLLCYGRTEDTYLNRAQQVHADQDATYRLAAVRDRGPTRLALSDRYVADAFRTITVEEAIKAGLLAPSWEDLAAKLYMNDQDILLMCLLSREEPLCLRFIEVERVKSYRDQHTTRTAVAKHMYMPRRITRSQGSAASKAGRRTHKQGLDGKRMPKQWAR
jgi:hypothetical protein